MFETLKGHCSTRLRGEGGVSTFEYAVMLAIVAIAVAIAVPGITTAVTGSFDAAIDALT